MPISLAQTAVGPWPIHKVGREIQLFEDRIDKVSFGIEEEHIIKALRILKLIIHHMQPLVGHMIGTQRLDIRQFVPLTGWMGILFNIKAL